MEDSDELELSFDFDVEDFSESEIDLEVEFETRYIKPPRTKQGNSFVKYDNAEKFADDIEINTGDRVFAIINGSFIFGDFIEAFIVSKRLRVKKMIISTLSMSENNIDSLTGLLKLGYVDELSLVISDYFFSHERRNLVEYIYEKLDIDNKFQLAVAGTHCKKCLIETHCGKKIVIHGSANLRSSGNIEQFVIEENEELYKFNELYQTAIIEKYSTIKKSIRRAKLWQVVAKDSKN